MSNNFDTTRLFVQKKWMNGGGGGGGGGGGKILQALNFTRKIHDVAYILLVKVAHYILKCVKNLK